MSKLPSRDCGIFHMLSAGNLSGEHVYVDSSSAEEYSDGSSEHKKKMDLQDYLLKKKSGFSSSLSVAYTPFPVNTFASKIPNQFPRMFSLSKKQKRPTRQKRMSTKIPACTKQQDAPQEITQHYQTLILIHWHHEAGRTH